jgi:hypothetical protein
MWQEHVDMGLTFRNSKQRSEMRGSITGLNKKLGCGFILGENGSQAYFDLSSLEGTDILVLSIGTAVEYQEHFAH